MKNIDYVLRVSGSPDQKEISDLLLKLKKINIIITAFHINEISDRLGKVFMF